MNRLIGTRTYLAGPIDRCPNHGRDWREEITPMLHERGIIVFDPLHKPLCSAQDETNHVERKKWIEEGRYDLIVNFMREIRGQDLRMVNTADFIIVKVDPTIHMCGSYEELAIANHEKKPILVWTVGGREKTPWWLFGMIPEAMIFGSLEDLVGYIDHIDTAEHIETYRRWILFEPSLVYNPKILDKISSRVYKSM